MRRIVSIKGLVYTIVCTLTVLFVHTITTDDSTIENSEKNIIDPDHQSKISKMKIDRKVGNQYEQEKKGYFDTNRKVLENVPANSGKIDSIPDLSWIQYGKEKSDWALLVNSWLCVQGKPDFGGRIKPRGEKELIIYSEQDFNLTKIPGNFKVTQKRFKPPDYFTFEGNRTVYFIYTRGHKGAHKIFFPNLHHFINDFGTVYYAIQNRIHHRPKQSVFFQYAAESSEHFLLPMMEAINITREHQYPKYDYHRVPHGTCFRQSVFADGEHSPFVPKSEQRHHDFETEVQPILESIKSSFHIPENQCEGEIHPKITLINRLDERDVVNEAELRQVLQKRYKNTQTVILEQLTLEDQMKTIHCTDVLIGVQGMGLQWTAFLQKRAAVIEISWPERGWHFFYADQNFAAEFYPEVRFYQLEIPPSNISFPDKVRDRISPKGLVPFYPALTGRPYVPVDSLVAMVKKAVSGAPNEAPWERFTIGEYKTRVSREQLKHLNPAHLYYKDD